MRKSVFLPFTVLILAACGPEDRCEAPAMPKLLTVNDMSLVDKANALGVPPDRVPVETKTAASYGALVAGANDSAEANSVYESFVDRKNAVVKQDYCVANEAYKARGMTDEMSTVARAVTATCKSGDEPAVLAVILRYRNCATGN